MSIKKRPMRSTLAGVVVAIVAAGVVSCAGPPAQETTPAAAQPMPRDQPAAKAAAPQADPVAKPAPAAAAAGSIGTATLEADGTIVLRLRTEGPGGFTGESLLRYPPQHNEYLEILKHVGGLKKGETKAVPPWPEK